MKNKRTPMKNDKSMENLGSNSGIEPIINPKTA